ncbi:MAG: maleylacetate reductase [Henriciella sp.]|nr:maleylacetate reductase [Henriciella sp.]
MDAFVYTGLPAHVVFGSGTVEKIGEELEALGINKALVLSTPPQAKQAQAIVDRLGDKAAGLFSNATMHTPTHITEQALAEFNRLGADGVVSIGGGSTIGLGKAIALRNDTPQLVLPTTYAGSEMTAIIGQTEDGLKTTQTTLKVLPETVIYDVDFTMTLPPVMSVTSGMNAIAHAVEAMYSAKANPVLSLMAEEAVAAMMRALPKITADASDRDARSDALYGAWLCAVCLGSGGVALHHKLCHVLGGTFNLPHAETHTIVLSHALGYNAPAVPETMARLARATGSDDPAGALYDVAKAGGAPMALKDIGMPEDGIEKAVEIAFKNPYFNPRPLEEAGIRAIIQAAWAGDRPS